MVSFYQIISSFDDVYGVRLSNNLTAWMSTLNILSLNLVGLLPLDCTIPSTLHQLILSALWPYFVLCIIFVRIIFPMVKRKLFPTQDYDAGGVSQQQQANEEPNNVYMSLIKWAIVIAYFTLPTVTRGIFDAIRCRAFQLDDEIPPNFESYLLVNMEIQCDDNNVEYNKIFSSFVILFMIWVVLTPAAFLVLLIKIRDAVQLNRITSLADSCRFLWEDFNPSLWYWDLIDIGRKLFLTGLVMFIDLQYGSTKFIRLAIATLVSVLYFGIFLAVNPYKQRGNYNFALLSNFLLICCFVLGCLVKQCEVGNDICQTLIGSGFDYNNLSILVVTLTLGFLILSILLLLVLSLNKIK